MAQSAGLLKRIKSDPLPKHDRKRLEQIAMRNKMVSDAMHWRRIFSLIRLTGAGLPSARGFAFAIASSALIASSATAVLFAASLPITFPEIALLPLMIAFGSVFFGSVCIISFMSLLSCLWLSIEHEEIAQLQDMDKDYPCAADDLETLACFTTIFGKDRMALSAMSLIAPELSQIGEADMPIAMARIPQDDANRLSCASGLTETTARLVLAMSGAGACAAECADAATPRNDAYGKMIRMSERGCVRDFVNGYDLACSYLSDYLNCKLGRRATGLQSYRIKSIKAQVGDGYDDLLVLAADAKRIADNARNAANNAYGIASQAGFDGATCRKRRDEAFSSDLACSIGAYVAGVDIEDIVPAAA